MALLDKILYIVRGVSGSGKSTFASTLGCDVHSADDYQVDNAGNYAFDPDNLSYAHMACQDAVRQDMLEGEDVIAVANTFTEVRWMQDYFDLAEAFGYTVFSIIVENRHGGKNIHEVPDEEIQSQKDKFEISL